MKPFTALRSIHSAVLLVRSWSLFLTLVCSLLLSEAAWSIAPDAGRNSRKTLEQFSQNVREVQLSNGLRILGYRRGPAPVFAGAVTVRVGGSDEQLGSTGISHMLEHMAFKGTPEIGTRDYAREQLLLEELEEIVSRSGPSGAIGERDKARWDVVQAELATLWGAETFTREYEKRGASGLNATTDTELTRYFVSLPTAAFEFWCWAESERILHPVMRQFYQERDVVMEERRMRYDDDPGGKLYEKLLGHAFTVHAYRNPVIGYPEDIAKLTATAMKEYHQRYYIPGNMVVTLVGDIDIDAQRPLLERAFGRIPSGSMPARPETREPEQREERRFSLELHASPQMIIAYRKAQYPHPDDPPLSVLFEILAGSPLSPLYHELVRIRRVATSLQHEEAPGSAYPNLVLFSVTPRAPHSNAEVIRNFDEVLDTFLASGPTAEQLENAKRSIAMSYLGQLNSNQAIALQLGSAEALYHDWRALVRWYDEAMQVTRDDVIRVGRQYLVRTSRTIGTVETEDAPRSDEQGRKS